MTGLDTAPLGILLWRWLLTWLGGFGIITLAVLVLPFLRIGGMQLFVLDLSAQAGKFVPRMLDLVVKIGLVYVGLTALGAIAFHIEGMSAFDAMGHSMAAVATAGFASHDEGFGYFHSPAIEWTATLLMLLAAMPFVLHLAGASPRTRRAAAGRAGPAVPVDHWLRHRQSVRLAGRLERGADAGCNPRSRFQRRLDHLDNRFHLDLPGLRPMGRLPLGAAADDDAGRRLHRIDRRRH